VGLADLLLDHWPRLFPQTYERIARAWLEPAYAALAEEVRARPDPQAALDYGTGPGSVALRLAQWCPDARIDAADVSDNLLIRAEDEARRKGLSRRIRFGLIDRGRFPWPEARYDLVVAAFVLYASGGAAALLDQIHLRLRPGARCLVVEGLRDAAVADAELFAACETARAPRLLRGALRRALAAQRARLLPRERILAAVRDSRFGVAARARDIGLPLPDRTVSDAFVLLELRAPEHVQPAAAAGEPARG